MKSIFTFCILLFVFQSSLAQSPLDLNQQNRKGDFFIYWGWNRGWFSTSDISFNGANYDFTLSKVVAKDRQSKFNIDPYFHISKFTIPQYNFKIGYFINDHYTITLGTDHMKYVVQPNQVVHITGQIANTETVYDGLYDNDEIALTADFLQFEHTDGLNYINADFRRFDELLQLNKFKISITEGIGIGASIPRTNTTLLEMERHDQFHLSGYGINVLAGINLQFFKYFFIQTEFKGGFINMPAIRSTPSPLDHASQHFFFTQWNILFGANFNFKEK